MNELDNTALRLVNRLCSPISLIDSEKGHELIFSKERNFLQIHSTITEIAGLQLSTGSYLVTVGNPFLHKGYRSELLMALNNNVNLHKWLRDCYREAGIYKVETPLMFEVKGCTRMTIDEKGMWQLFYPDGLSIMGSGMVPKSIWKRFSEHCATRFMYHVEDLLMLCTRPYYEKAE